MTLPSLAVSVAPPLVPRCLLAGTEHFRWLHLAALSLTMHLLVSHTTLHFLSSPLLLSYLLCFYVVRTSLLQVPVLFLLLLFLLLLLSCYPGFLRFCLKAICSRSTLSPISHLPLTYLSPTSRLPLTYLSPSSHLALTSLSPTSHLPLAYLVPLVLTLSLLLSIFPPPQIAQRSLAVSVTSPPVTTDQLRDQLTGMLQQLQYNTIQNVSTEGIGKCSIIYAWVALCLARNKSDVKAEY